VLHGLGASEGSADALKLFQVDRLKEIMCEPASDRGSSALSVQTTAPALCAPLAPNLNALQKHHLQRKCG